jgi:L-serine dehydratase
LGALARAIFGKLPSAVVIGLHGSFASTGKGHGTDLALVAGLLGMAPDDSGIPFAFESAREAGMQFAFTEKDLGEAHPNSAEFLLTDADGRSMSVRGSSLGGGDVVVTAIDDFDIEANGELPLLVVEHLDRPGEIAAVSGILADSGVNIAEMRVSREKRGARALMLIETDAEVDDVAAERIASQPGISAVSRVAAV